MFAWRLKVPSILLLLTFGFIAGSLTGFLDPDAIFGDLLFPLVSISVAIILFEGGLSLRFEDIPGLRGLIFNLISIGVLITWGCLSFAGYYLLDLNFELSILLAAILTVTGPTVIIPLLNHVRPKPPLGPILKWEGILIDPVGATLAVLVFEVVHYGISGESTATIITGLLHTILIGFSIGTIFAFLFSKAIKLYWIPEHLQSPLALCLVIFVYALSDHFQAESGLLAVTVMGVILANITNITVRHILEFKETLRELLIASLFVVLAARLDLKQLLEIDLVRASLFLAFTIFIVRPLAVFVSALGSGLSWREKIFLAFIAPRGIVAAAVASVFAIQLQDAFGSDSSLLVSYVFIVIIGTVVFHSLTASPLARLLKLKEDSTNGLLIIGANPLAIKIDSELKENDVNVVLIDTNPRNVFVAIKTGLKAINGDFLRTNDERKIDLAGLGKMLALTPNNEANSIAALHFSEVFGRSGVFQLQPVNSDSTEINQRDNYLHGRFLFNQYLDYYALEDLLFKKGKLMTLPLETDESFSNLVEQHKENMIPLFFIHPDNQVEVFTYQDELKPKTGSKLIALIREEA